MEKRKSPESDGDVTPSGGGGGEAPLTLSGWSLSHVIGNGSFGVTCALVSPRGTMIATKMCGLDHAALCESRMYADVILDVTRSAGTRSGGRARAPMSPNFLRFYGYAVAQSGVPKHSGEWGAAWAGTAAQVWREVDRRWEETRSARRRRRHPKPLDAWGYAQTALCRPTSPTHNIHLETTSPAPICHLLTEYARGGSLASAMDAGMFVDRRAAHCAVFQACHAMAVLHAKGVHHRDFHCGNIVLRKHTARTDRLPLYHHGGAVVDAHACQGTDAVYTLCVIDFGSSAHEDTQRQSLTVMPVTLLVHRAPELLFWGGQCVFERASDVWALGIVMLTVAMNACARTVAHERRARDEALQRQPPERTGQWHPLLTPNHYEGVTCPPVPMALIQEIAALPRSVSSRTWHFVTLETPDIVATYVWYLLHALGLPSRHETWPALSTSPLFNVARTHYVAWMNNALLRMSQHGAPQAHAHAHAHAHAKHHRPARPPTEGGWVWHHRALRVFLGRSGMYLLRAMTHWNPQHRTTNLLALLEHHRYFKPLRRQGARIARARCVRAFDVTPDPLDYGWTESTSRRIRPRRAATHSAHAPVRMGTGGVEQPGNHAVHLVHALEGTMLAHDT